VDWHLFPAAWVLVVAVTLIHKVLKGISTVHQHSSLAILAVNHILRVQGCCRSNVSSLLPIIGHVKGDSSLPLRFIHDPVHGVKQRHFTIHVDTKVFGEIRVLGGIDD